MAGTSVKEVGAVADIALVCVRPFNEAEVTVCWCHVGNLPSWIGLGNDFGDLPQGRTRVPVVLHMRQCLKPRHLKTKRLTFGSGTDLDAGGGGGVDRVLAHGFF